MLVRSAPDEPFPLEGVEPVHDGFVGGDVTARLDFADERGVPMLSDVALNILEDPLLLLGDLAQVRDSLVGSKYYYEILVKINISSHRCQKVSRPSPAW
jgi:hypothetical protein